MQFAFVRKMATYSGEPPTLVGMVPSVPTQERLCVDPRSVLTDLMGPFMLQAGNIKPVTLHMIIGMCSGPPLTSGLIPVSKTMSFTALLLTSREEVPICSFGLRIQLYGLIQIPLWWMMKVHILPAGPKILLG